MANSVSSITDPLLPGDIITSDFINGMRADIAGLQARVAKLESSASTGPMPEILDLNPRDEVEAGQVVEIIGRNLPSEPTGTSVDFDGHPVTRYFSATGTSLVVGVPLGISGLPKPVTITVRNLDQSATATIRVVAEKPKPQGQAVITDNTGDLGQIDIGETYTFVFQLDSQTTIPEIYRLSMEFTDAVGATSQAWRSNAQITFPDGRSIPQELEVSPTAPVVIHITVEVPGGAVSVNLSLGAEPQTNPILPISGSTVFIEIGQQQPVNDSRTTFTLGALGPFANARRAAIDGRQGYEVRYNNGELITVTARFTAAGRYEYSHELEANPGNVWAITNFNPSSPTGEIVNSEEDISLRLTLNSSGGQPGQHPERAYLRIMARRTDSDAIGTFLSWLRFPIQGF